MHVMYGEDGVTLKVYSHYNVKCFYTYLKKHKSRRNPWELLRPYEDDRDALNREIIANALAPYL